MIVIDCEFSGIDPARYGLVSIGSVDLNNPSNRFYGECRIPNNLACNPKSIEVCGFTEAQVRDPNKQSEKELLLSFIEWMKPIPDKTMAGHNPGIDRDHLQAIATRNTIAEWNEIRRTVDLHTVCYVYFLQHNLSIPMRQDQQSGIDSDTIFLFVGLPTEPKPHNALTGALMEAEAFSRLLFQKKAIVEYQEYPIKM